MKDFKIKDYISIARPGHWFKNIFILPGILFAYILTNIDISVFIRNIFFGILSTCLIASANYVINEWVDAKYDQYHPLKKHRPSVLGKIKASYVYFEYFLLSIMGLIIAFKISIHFFFTSVFFLIMGILYNLRPFRAKDRTYLDVLVESINNPIRLMLGWFIVTSSLFPPSSFIFGYWMSGAFLMAVKRYSELKYINDSNQAKLYRKSFEYYTEENLLISSFLYAILSAFFLGVFLVKYRIELMLCLPFLAILFAWYLHLGMLPNSPAQNPEKLFLQKDFAFFVLLTSILIIDLLIIDIPSLRLLLNNAFVK